MLNNPVKITDSINQSVQSEYQFLSDGQIKAITKSIYGKMFDTIDRKLEVIYHNFPPLVKQLIDSQQNSVGKIVIISNYVNKVLLSENPNLSLHKYHQGKISLIENLRVTDLKKGRHLE